MLDYKLLQALATVIECDGFERAGEQLGLSQSAISQRIKSLEVRLGQPVLIRHPRLAPTPAGQRLLNHVQQVQQQALGPAEVAHGLGPPGGQAIGVESNTQTRCRHIESGKRSTQVTFQQLYLLIVGEQTLSCRCRAQLRMSYQHWLAKTYFQGLDSL